MMITEHDMTDTYHTVREALDAIANAALQAHFDDDAEDTARNLAFLVMVGEAVEHVKREAVEQLRAYDVPWSLIAGGLGVTKQAAQQRYRTRQS